MAQVQSDLRNGREHYRVFLYAKQAGDVTAKVFLLRDVEQALSEGWKLTPGEFADPDNEVADTPEFTECVDGISQDMNYLLNVDDCHRDDLIPAAERVLGIKINKKMSVTNIRKRVKNEIKKQNWAAEYVEH